MKVFVIGKFFKDPVGFAVNKNIDLFQAGTNGRSDNKIAVVADGEAQVASAGAGSKFVWDGLAVEEDGLFHKNVRTYGKYRSTEDTENNELFLGVF